MPSFEWDPLKAKENLRKHRVSFDEARTAFYDENGVKCGQCIGISSLGKPRSFEVLKAALMDLE